VVYAHGEDSRLPASVVHSAGASGTPVQTASLSAHPKHRLDVYIPSGGSFPRPLSPILLFVHGGSWQGGDRQHALADHLYSNVGIAAARAGYVGMVMSYRTARPVWDLLGESLSDVAWEALSPGATAGLAQSTHSRRPLQAVASAAASMAATGPSTALAGVQQAAATAGAASLWGGASDLLSWLTPPPAPLPSDPTAELGTGKPSDAPEHPFASSYEEQAEDVAAAVAWAMQHGRRFGGDAERLVLAGHSAGAHLAALVAAQPKWMAQAGVTTSQAGSPSPLGGLVLLSGVFNIPRLATTPLGPMICRQAFGAGEARWREASPTLHGTGPDSPLHSLPVLAVNAEEDGHLEQDAEEFEARLALGGLLRAGAPKDASQGGHARTDDAADHTKCWWGDTPETVLVRPQLLPGSTMHRAVVRGRGHMTSVMGIGQVADGTGAAIMGFLKTFIG